MRELQAAVGTSPSKHTVRRILREYVSQSQSGQKGQEIATAMDNISQG